MRKFRISLRDIFWLIAVVAVSVVASINYGKLVKTENELQAIQSELAREKMINDQLGDKLKQAIASAGEMFAAGRASHEAGKDKNQDNND